MRRSTVAAVQWQLTTLEIYSTALQLSDFSVRRPSDKASLKAVLLSNRSAAYRQLGLLDAAERDAQECVRVVPLTPMLSAVL